MTGTLVRRCLSIAVVLITSVSASPGRVASAVAISRPATVLSCTACYLARSVPHRLRAAAPGQGGLRRPRADGSALEFEPTTTNATDLRTGFTAYDSAFGLPAPSLNFVDELAPTRSPWLASGEEVEDAEMAHAMAPGATISVVLLKEFSTVTGLVAELTAGLRLATTLGGVVSLSASSGEDCFSPLKLSG